MCANYSEHSGRLIGIYGNRGGLLRIVKTFHENSTAVVRVNGMESKSSTVNFGVGQECLMCRIMFRSWFFVCMWICSLEQ